MRLAVLVEIERPTGPRSRVINPGVFACSDSLGECYVGLARFVQAGVHHQEEVASVVSDVTVLEQEAVRSGNGDGVRQ